MYTRCSVFARKVCFRRHLSNIFAFKRVMSVESVEKRPRFEADMKDHIIWVDLEMSGLDVDKECILEMACLVTDKDLNVIAEAPDLIIHQPKEVMDNMGDWCQEQHGQSGLTEAVRTSKISLQEAERQMLEFVKQHTLSGKSPLAGNSVSTDRFFLMKHMPNFTQHLHYRIVDVSTIKELCILEFPCLTCGIDKHTAFCKTCNSCFIVDCGGHDDCHRHLQSQKRWYPEEFRNVPKKMKTHRALDDIKESIKELKYYRKMVFKEG